MYIGNLQAIKKFINKCDKETFLYIPTTPLYNPFILYNFVSEVSILKFLKINKLTNK